MSKLFQREDDIVALATPFFSSALCVIRSSGVSSIEKFSKIFSDPKRLLEAPGHTIHYGYIIDKETCEKLDEVVVCLYRAPKSFTGQDSIEVMAHGSLIGIKRIIDFFLKVGFRMAEPGEFTLRSFLAGKLDLTKAEAVNELISAKTNKTHALAVNNLSGSLFAKIDLIKKNILNFLSALSVHLDYETDEYEVVIPFDAISKSGDELKRLIDSYDTARKLDHGITLVLAGSVNVGKSSLFNLLLKEDRAIVSSYAGTTRDYIQASFELDGILFNVFDTAGLRETSDFVEQLGIVRSNSLIKEASLVLYVIDLSARLTNDDLKFIDSYMGHSKVLFVLNKMDLEQDSQTVDFFNSGNINSSNLVKISTKTLFGIDSLYDKIRSLTCFDYIDINAYDVIVSSSRQAELLKKAYTLIIELLDKIEQDISYDMLAFDVYEVINLLGEITGEVTSEDVLNDMFKNFCLGK
ncbi:TRNA (5-carboxymethylaminomethyl-2-thiouridylate) synthase [Borrelia nietonii YOR]|uniref:tRNA modification GTPase MnmE n=1 Tax=Borrelia nietonii YOR TaxID=1293576 RepID=A0ABN4C629_9SPIR|nr:MULTISPECIES: tRNA uridine-5-carboxymethylaminomethyl(34) synthesis GTPase MnmE [Borrelia]AHH03138.1 TRNA (5-carboxymethylaminomethyl-2-thiouridylate) synthase [Borrelia nietonii YOR]AHH13676.1 TRNA (5-carboxymethylaminomethyl-2-thiouridylate) synthase [Borrelia hermsii MTW]UPA08905.1 tRNA uridine-5-carboxymethylaminomethyl(34) synthesis GTPase MnmE [Borrelia nietonii YOR]